MRYSSPVMHQGITPRGERYPYDEDYEIAEGEEGDDSVAALSRVVGILCVC